MSDATEAAPPPMEKKKGILIPLIVAALMGAGGFASTFLGFWSPADLFSTDPKSARAEAGFEFMDIPTIEMTIPGANARSLVLAVSLEVAPRDRAAVQAMMPRVLDAMNGFLSDIDPAAYDKRGVLEIIRAELLTRIGHVLGGPLVKDLLITEFRIR